jgi:hypothetical protein
MLWPYLRPPTPRYATARHGHKNGPTEKATTNRLQCGKMFQQPQFVEGPREGKRLVGVYRGTIERLQLMSPLL